MRRIYLDNNASTVLDPRIADSLHLELKELLGNPSSVHFHGQQVRARLTACRDLIASFLRVKSHELIFTSGGTEGLNMVIRGMLPAPKGHIITSNVEHACVYVTIKKLEAQGCRVTYLPVGLRGAVESDAVRSSIRSDTCLISLMAVNNETGVRTDIEAIASIAAHAGIPFLVDGVALLGKELFTIPAGVSAMCFSGHKMHALQGTGLTFARSNLKLDPFITGGEQEFGRRGGTENMIGILSLAKAFELLKTELPEASQKMHTLRDKFESLLLDQLDVSINGQGPRVGNTSNLAFADVDGESLLMQMDKEGISASHGSACASGAIEPSRILTNMGIAPSLVRSSIRFSLSRFTTEQEIQEAAGIIVKIVKNHHRVHREHRGGTR